MEHAAPVPQTDHAAGAVDNRKLAVWFFIASEVIFFSALITAYTLYHVETGKPHVLDVATVAVNTFLLLTSSYTMVRALAAVQEDNQRAFRLFMLATIVLGIAFVSIQAFEYSKLAAEGVTPSGSVFGATFFGLTGFHGAHVIVGVLWLLIVLVKGLAGNYGSRNTLHVELAALYWHFVDLVWVLLFTLIYLIP